MVPVAVVLCTCSKLLVLLHMHTLLAVLPSTTLVCFKGRMVTYCLSFCDFKASVGLPLLPVSSTAHSPLDRPRLQQHQRRPAGPPSNTGPCFVQLKPSLDVARPTLNFPAEASKEMIIHSHIPRPSSHHLRVAYECSIPISRSTHIKQGTSVVVSLNSSPVATILISTAITEQRQHRCEDHNELLHASRGI